MLFFLKNYILKKEINILLEYISFEIEDKDILKIKNFLKQYIQTFIKDNLIAGTHNFYNFKNQKKEMELLLISMTKSSKS